jgi:hypothetical protein
LERSRKRNNYFGESEQFAKSYLSWRTVDQITKKRVEQWSFYQKTIMKLGQVFAWIIFSRIRDRGIGLRAASNLSSKSRHWKSQVLNKGEECRQHGVQSPEKAEEERVVEEIAVGEETVG